MDTRMRKRGGGVDLGESSELGVTGRKQKKMEDLGEKSSEMGNNHRDIGENPFEALPHEIREEILSKLDLMGKQTARLVCREWKNVVDNRLVDMDVRLSNRTLEYVEKIDPNRRIRRLMVDKLSKPIKTSTRNRSSLPKNVKILQFVTDEFCTDTCCTPVGVMSIPNASYSRRGTSEANIRELLRVYRDIEVLVVEEMALKNVRSSGVLKKLQLNHLTTLEIMLDAHDLCPMRMLLSNKFPSLKDFAFLCDVHCCPIIALIEVYRFIVKHKETIKAVNILSLETYDYSCPETSVIPPSEYKTMLSVFGQIQLDMLSIRLQDAVPESMSQLKELEHNFILSQKSLKILWIHKIEEMHPLLSVLPQCQNTLVELNIVNQLMSDADAESWIHAAKFDCALLKDCSKLRKLHLDFGEKHRDNDGVDRDQLSRSRVINLHLLPQSIKIMKLGGKLIECDANTVFNRLNQLKSFDSYVESCSDCCNNLLLFLIFLQNSQATEFGLIGHRCRFLVTLSNLLRQGITIIPSGQSIELKMKVDRSKLNLVKNITVYYNLAINSTPHRVSDDCCFGLRLRTTAPSRCFLGDSDSEFSDDIQRGVFSDDSDSDGE